MQARAAYPTAGKQRGDAAGGDGDHENNDTRGFHTGTSYNHAATRQRVATVTRGDRQVVAYGNFSS